MNIPSDIYIIRGLSPTNAAPDRLFYWQRKRINSFTDQY